MNEGRHLSANNFNLLSSSTSITLGNGVETEFVFAAAGGAKTAPPAAPGANRDSCFLQYSTVCVCRLANTNSGIILTTSDARCPLPAPACHHALLSPTWHMHGATPQAPLAGQRQLKMRAFLTVRLPVFARFGRLVLPPPAAGCFRQSFSHMSVSVGGGRCDHGRNACPTETSTAATARSRSGLRGAGVGM